MPKWIKYSLAFLLAAAFGFFLFIKILTQYSGTKDIILLNQKEGYTSLKRILQSPAFRGKTIYVDIWGTSCPPCYEEMSRFAPQLTNLYKDSDDIVFLYFCIDRHPFPETRWKSRLKELQPKGYHILIDAENEKKLAMDIIGEAVEGQYYPYLPSYFIVDKNGAIVKRPTLNPEESEKQPSSTHELYSRLDSIRHI